MREPSLRTSRLAIAGGLVGAIALAGAGFLLGRTTSPTAETPPPAPPVMPQATPTERAAPQKLGRADLIALGNEAADALARGAALPGGSEPLAGRRFELVLPFGCEGPSADSSGTPLRWTYAEDAQKLSISVAPVQWSPEDWELVRSDAALEGFWVDHPWSLSEACPERRTARPLGSQPATLPGQTLAVAQIMPRTDLRERPYEIVKRMTAEALPQQRGFRLRLVGRLERLPSGRVVQCVQPAGSEQRPLCLIGMSLEELRVENPGGGEALGIFSSRPAAPDEPRDGARP